MGTATIIQTHGLTKIYGQNKASTTALKDLNLSIERGEIFGYLGPNGAGKTTTIRLLLDLIRPTQGSANIFGKDSRQDSVDIHRKIGFLPGELNLWKGRTGQQIVHYLASVRGDVASIEQEAKRLSEQLKLDLSKKVRDYSSGNKRKLGLVLAMMHQPDLLILDEPTSGLDPLMQQTFNQMMHDFRKAGKTVFLSSHVLSEVQTICDRVGILRDGDLKAVETIEKLTHVEFRWVEITFDRAVSETLCNTLKVINGIHYLQTKEADTLRLQLTGDFDPLLRALNGSYIKDLRVHEPTLEEIFLAFYSDGKEQIS